MAEERFFHSTTDQQQQMTDSKLKELFFHQTPKVEPKCEHEWPTQEGAAMEDKSCVKCGMSFVRYAFTECP